MKKFKDIKAIKTNPEPAKGKNVDPGQLGQYSAKHQVSESTSLNQYLSSRGINPKFVSTATKIAHSKSALFIKWKQDHMQREETVNEVKMDNISPAAQNHVTKGRVVKINVGYGKPETDRPKPKVKPKKIGFFKKLFTSEEVQLEASKLSALDRFRAAAAAREIKHNDIEKERQERLHKEPSASNLPHRDVKKDGMSDAISRLEKHMNKEEVELDEGISDFDRQEKSRLAKAKISSAALTSKPHDDKLLARTGMNMAHKFPRKGQTNLGNIPAMNTPGNSPETDAYAEKRRGDRAKELKPAIKSALGTHGPKSKLPEEVEFAEEQLLDEMINEVLGKDASAGDWIHDFVHSDNPKFAGKSKAERKKMALGAYYGKQNEEFEQLDELKKSTVFSWLKQQPVVPVRKPNSDRVSYNQKVKNHSKSWNRALDRLSGYKPTSEDMWQDTQAATQTPADGANGGNELAERKRQMSKSARMIKALYKRKGVVKEDMYDHEKEDKSVATYGKKPKMSQTDKKDSLGENKPQAAATLTGGTTLTGVKRDSIEIDPIMRNRPGQPDISKKSDKKENNKNDK
jgi:hypothetical protein